MKTFKNFLWLLPLLVLIYVYASEGVGGLSGNSHTILLNTLGYSSGVTHLLLLISLIIDFGGALLAIFYPSKWTFLALGLWVWIPRTIALQGGIKNEWTDSIIASISAMLAYYAYTKGYYLKLSRNR